MYKNQTFINHVLLQGQELTEMTVDQILNWGEREKKGEKKEFGQRIFFQSQKMFPPQKRQH